jgi:hypothetical protein
MVRSLTLGSHDLVFCLLPILRPIVYTCITKRNVGNGYLNCRVFLKYPVRFMGTRLTNAISCFDPGPHEPYRDMGLTSQLG